MRIIQVAHAMTKDDGASRHVLNMDHILKQLGYDTVMFSHKIDARIEADIHSMEEFDADAKDILIYQMTSGTSFNQWVYRYPHKIVLYYHNITPARYFFGNAWGSWFKCLKGRRDLRRIVGNAFYGWGASEYSCQELKDLGLAHTSVMPAVVEPQHYLGYGLVQPLYEKYHDGWLNLLIVGRGVPHKKQDEAIAITNYYKEHISAKVRLIIVGNIKPSFAKKLHAMVDSLELAKHVVFAGQVSNEELCTLYRLSDAVLSMSEHEGFCVPLVEGMIFGKPVFAYSCAAVPETLGRAGILLSDKTPAVAAECIHRSLQDQVLLEQLAVGRRERLQELSYDNIVKKIEYDMQKILELWGRQTNGNQL